MTTSIDRVLYNGSIHTLAAAVPHATALALHGGRVVAVGSDDDMLALAGRNTVREDLGGQTVIPGLVDAHIHWRWTSEHLQNVNVFEVPTKAAAVAAVAERVAQTPPGEWIRGHGWAQALWPSDDFPTAADLDAVAPHNPVFLTGKSVHVAWANTAAMQAANMTANTPNPDGGAIQRDEHGQPTGILFEAPAMRLIADVIPAPTPEEVADWMLAAQKLAHQQGITAIHDLDNPDCLMALQVLRERGELGLRVVKYINKAYLAATIASGVRFGLGDDWLRFGGLKLFADGALGPRTAYMLAPYEEEPDNCGMVVTPVDEMRRLVHQATLSGLPTAIHAIGDRSVREVLDVFASARQLEAEHGIARAQRRHRIEHVQVIHPDDVGRLAELDVIASMQPVHATSDAEVADRYWGERAALSYNARVQIDAGARVAFGSDSPVEPFDPFMGIHAAVTRNRADGSLGAAGWRPDAKLTVDEALRGFTQGAAYAGGVEDRQGQLAPGYYADLLLLDRDPYTVPADELINISVLGTMVDGEWRHGGV